MTPREVLFAFDAQTSALGQVMGRLGWDQETVMPRGSADQRADEIAALEGVLHARRKDPRLEGWLAEAEPQSPAERARIALIRRDFEKAQRLPDDLATALARLASSAQGVWAEAREAGDVTGFLPVLSQMVALKREAASALSPGGDAYDVMVDDYEPGMPARDIAALFDRMRPRLVALRDKVLAAGRDAPSIGGYFPMDAQLAFNRDVAARFGYDLTRGRIDQAVHPFSSGSGDDVRITTRVDESNPFWALYSTIHEVGHATYEQNIDPAYRLTRLGTGVSMGVHESQSRICENQLARSEAFCTWLHGEMVERFGAFEPDTAAAFYEAANRVSRGFIRTEADEIQYNLHIMLRFDLERAIFAEDLAVADVEAAWNDRFEADFGVQVPGPAVGMLQDIHWSAGLFGYFPTYTLGNVYAGCLNAAMHRDVPELEADLAQGVVTRASAWLAEKVQRHGSAIEARAVIEEATGQVVSEEPLLRYLEDKFAALYGV